MSCRSGQPYAWKARPKALKLQYYAEHIGIADIDKNFGAPIHEGDRDKARIMVAIVDWNTRREVGSGTEAPTGTWDPEETTSVDEGPIIAYGSLFIDQSSTRRQDDRRTASAQLLRHEGQTLRIVPDRDLLLDERLRRLHGRLQVEHTLRRQFRVGLLTMPIFATRKNAEPHRFCFLFTLAVQKKNTGGGRVSALSSVI